MGPGGKYFLLLHELPCVVEQVGVGLRQMLGQEHSGRGIAQFHPCAVHLVAHVTTRETHDDRARCVLGTGLESMCSRDIGRSDVDVQRVFDEGEDARLHGLVAVA